MKAMKHRVLWVSLNFKTQLKNVLFWFYMSVAHFLFLGSSMNKFGANAVYNDVINLVSLKTISREYEHSKIKMAALSGLARRLQKLTTSSDVDLHAVQVSRDEFFKMLVNIYSGTMQHSNLQELDQTYDFLVFLNVKMIDALKRSHTGNENVVPMAGCYCRNGTCVQVRCPPKCHATCRAEPFLTRYLCNINNLTVPVKAICNGKKDCPNEEDEKDCKKGKVIFNRFNRSNFVPYNSQSKYDMFPLYCFFL